MSWLPDWITGYDRDAYEQGLEADKKNRAITEDLHNQGLITDKEYKEAIDHYDAAAAYNPDAEINAATQQGLDSGADNIRGFLGGVIDKVATTPLRIIPWQVWLALGLYVAWRLGWFKKWIK
jgi:hypothetical protein